MIKRDRHNTRKMDGRLHIFRLKNYVGGLKETLKNWIEDYLKGREMKTVVKDEKSEWREVKS